MAKCRDCGKDVIWARLAGGDNAGKNRPFDVDGSESGRYGLKPTEDQDKFGNQILEAHYYSDPLKGLESNDKLFDSHFVTCEAKKSGGKVYRPSGPSGAGSKVFVMVQINDEDYSGYVNKVTREAIKEEEVPF